MAVRRTSSPRCMIRLRSRWQETRRMAGIRRPRYGNRRPIVRRRTAPTGHPE
nr:MAG TPA: hypothetical protein [Caudoviricetes sp.]